MIDQTIFRAYDIRGTYPDQLNAEVAESIGKGFGTYLIRHHNFIQPKVVVGRDARTHSPELQQAFIQGLISTGCHVINVGLSPSPLLYFSNTIGKFDAGCNITASHNPGKYNGFKLMTKDAHAVFGDDIQVIREIIENQDFEIGEGSLSQANFLGKYIQKIKKMFCIQSSVETQDLASPDVKEKMKVVIDCGNGIAGAFYPKILRELGYEVTELYCELDGTFPNHEPDPIVEGNLKDLKQKVLELKANIGLAFDGDGDRVGIVTETGKFINADKLLMLLTKDVLTRHPKSKIVFTVSNSQVLFDLTKQWGGNPIMCKVGHSYVENAMHEHHAILGGEQSGHFFLPEDYYGYDDALITACRILAIANQNGKPVSELFSDFPPIYSEPEMRPYCADDLKFEVLEKIMNYFKDRYPSNTLDGIRMDFGNGSWAGIRVSNTSPCLSVIMEGGSRKALDEVKVIVLEHLKTYPEIVRKR